MKHKLLLIYSWFIYTVLFFFPEVPVIMRLRGFLYGLGMKSCGRNFLVTHDSIIRGLENISIGNNVRCGNGIKILGSGQTIIEDDIRIGINTLIMSGNHGFANGSFRYGNEIRGVVTIEKGSWTAANTVLLPGAILPEGSVLAANGVLNKAFSEKYCIYGGLPAKKIKELKTLK